MYRRKTMDAIVTDDFVIYCPVALESQKPTLVNFDVELFCPLEDCLLIVKSKQLKFVETGADKDYIFIDLEKDTVFNLALTVTSSEDLNAYASSITCMLYKKVSPGAKEISTFPTETVNYQLVKAIKEITDGKDN